MGQTETPELSKGKSQVENGVLKSPEIESIFSKQVACPTEYLVAKEIPTLVADLLDDIRQCSYEKARSGARSLVYNVIEQIPFDFLRGEVKVVISHKQIAKYFDINDTAYDVCEKLLSSNAFMAPDDAFVQRRTIEAVTAEHVATKMTEQLI